MFYSAITAEKEVEFRPFRRVAQGGALGGGLSGCEGEDMQHHKLLRHPNEVAWQGSGRRDYAGFI